MDDDDHVRRILDRPISRSQDLEKTRRLLREAAGGALPYRVRTMMRDMARRVLASEADATDRETAKLTMAYARWATELAEGTPGNFERFMKDQLEQLDIQYP